MATFVLATANPHKAAEMRQILEPDGVELLSRPPSVPEVHETEDTLEGNALLKARALCAATGRAAIADDTGLFIDALDGRPGVYSARYAGKGASSAQNVRKVLAELATVTRRDARFRSVIAVVYPDASSWWVDGVLEGEILREPVGDGGFGYDAIFAPRGSETSLAQLSASEKNKISHRALALANFAVRLSQR